MHFCISFHKATITILFLFSVNMTSEYFQKQTFNQYWTLQWKYELKWLVMYTSPQQLKKWPSCLTYLSIIQLDNFFKEFLTKNERNAMFFVANPMGICNRNKLNIFKNNDLSFIVFKPHKVQLHIYYTYILTTIHLIFTKMSLK